jgi:hypothetical protein
MYFVREDGVLDGAGPGVEYRVHRYGIGKVRRVPWYQDADGKWTSGVPDSAISVHAVLQVAGIDTIGGG